MAMAERREQIVEFINREGNVTFAQLKNEFPDVSEMTLRTDLKTLDKQRQIIRVHGGARSVGFAVGTDDLITRRVERRSQEKTIIARKALSLIHSRACDDLHGGWQAQPLLHEHHGRPSDQVNSRTNV